MYPQITSDGAAGAIVTWQDYRGGSADIYAQWVNASGAVQWTADGIAICAATEDQVYPKITSDGAGGAIVTWEDYRNDGKTDIYAQRVDASGVVQWMADGVALCTATGWQYDHETISDGEGGAIVTWADQRGYDNDIYAQRVDASGVVRWTADGVPLCAATESQFCPTIASDGSGGAIVAWKDNRRRNPNDYYAQRVDASGVVQWTANGVALCTATGYDLGYQPSPEITSDGAGGAIVTWQDYRNGNYDIYAQRVDASGTAQWTADGVALCTATRDQEYPTITSAGAGGAIVTWYDGRDGELSRDIYTQRVDASGTVQWTADGVACTAIGSQRNTTLTSDDGGGAIVVWEDRRNGSADIYAQRVNALGQVQWAAEGVALCTATGDQSNPRIISDGAEGAIVTWMDNRDANYDVYAQRVKASGVVQWAANGVALCTATGDQGSPEIISDGAGGAIVAWHDNRGGVGDDIYAQRVNASGVVQWTVDGASICTAVGDQDQPTITSDGAGGSIVTWRDERSGVDNDIYTQRVNASGAVQWTADGDFICTAAGNQLYPAIASDGAGGAIITWQDLRGVDSDIYAQRVNASGAVQWTADGVAICTASGDGQYSEDSQYFPQIISDGEGGAIVTWYAEWSSPADDHCDISSQRVDASGAVQWTMDGVFIDMWTWGPSIPRIISDGAAGEIVTWARDGCVYAERVNASGTSLWSAALSAPNGQTNSAITSDGAGGAVVAWEDGRSGTLIYAQRITASGEFVATTLQNYSVALVGSSVQLEWALAEMDADVHFSILRASAPEWEFVDLAGAAIAKNGFSYVFTDVGCLPGTTYKYRVEYEAKGIPRKLLFESEEITMPALPVTLYQNQPNPFNPRTVIRFYLPEAREAVLDVYDVAGRRIARLAEGKREKGYHEVTWDGRNVNGTICSSGVYFCRLTAGKSSISRKIVIMR